MKVGDIVQVNDLCTHDSLRGAIGTVVETHIEEAWHSWLLVDVLINDGFIRFRQDTPMLETI